MSLSRPKTSTSAVAEYKLVVLGCGGTLYSPYDSLLTHSRTRSRSLGVGKSALAKQFVHARFQDDYDPTMSGILFVATGT